MSPGRPYDSKLGIVTGGSRGKTLCPSNLTTDAMGGNSSANRAHFRNWRGCCQTPGSQGMQSPTRLHFTLI